MTALHRRRAVRALLDSPVRHLVQNAALSSPAARRLAQRGHRTGIDADHAVAAAVVADLVRLQSAAGVDLAGARVLELGPGRSPHVLAAALALGARTAWGADTERYLDVAATVDLALLDRELRAVGLDVRRRPVLDAPAFGVHVYDGRRLPVDDGSIDVVWSHSVLEHVRAPRDVLRETHRVVRPGGVVVSVVDLRDHLRLAPGQDHLHMLRRSDKLFDLMMSNRSSWVNRLRASEWRELALGAGFEVVVDERESAPLPAGFDRALLAPRFRRFDDAELGVTWWRSVLRRVA